MSSRVYKFVVHEHGTKRHHYDFRLEINGVLKSWAIPKGPSLDPADKRLAVMVPDHPLEYGEFEGIIPPGRYGAGPVVIWDTGEFISIDADSSSALEQGKLSFELTGKKLKGVFTITHMKGLPRGTGKEWLLIKKNDSHAKAGYTIKSALTPQKVRSLAERVPPCETE